MSVAGIPFSLIRRRTGGSRSLPKARARTMKNSSVRACSPASTRGFTHPEISAPTSAFCGRRQSRSMLTGTSRNFPSRRVHRGLRAHEISPSRCHDVPPADDSEGVQRHGCSATRRRRAIEPPDYWTSPTRPSSTKACLAKGDAMCTYVVTWKPFTSPGVATSLEPPAPRSPAAPCDVPAVDSRWASAAGNCAALGGVIVALSTG